MPKFPKSHVSPYSYHLRLKLVDVVPAGGFCEGCPRTPPKACWCSTWRYWDPGEEEKPSRKRKSRRRRS